MRLLRCAPAALILASCARAPAPPADQTASRLFSSDRITVETRGAGPDIVLIPGMNSSRDVWNGVADSLAGRYRLHLVQLNGFAGLPAGANAEGPVSAPVAEEIARYIAAAGLSKPAVVGHSMGGTIVLMLAARHPDLVGRVMVVDMPPFLGVMFGGMPATPESVRPIADSIRTAMLAAPPGAPTMFELMAPTMTRVDSLKAALIAGSKGSNLATTANAFHELIVTDLRPELLRITMPMTVLYVIPPNAPMPPDQLEAAVKGSYATVPNLQIVRVADSYHFIQFDQPGRVVAELEALMKR